MTLSTSKILPDWTLFDNIYTSFTAGKVKPELGYYEDVLKDLRLPDWRSAIFVDDKVTNVSAAQACGMQGIVFDSGDALIRQLRNRIFDQESRARHYMKTKAHDHHSQTESGKAIRDVFSQFLIHYELQDTSLISLSPAAATSAEIITELTQAAEEARTWNYFIGPPVDTTSTFPNDVDDTAYALLSFAPPAESANPILDQFLANRHTRDGLIQTYFDKNRPRVCPFVLVNVLRVFYRYSRGEEVQNELNHVRNILDNCGYENGAAQYISAEPFLYFMACLIKENPEKKEIQELRTSVIAGLRKRVGCPGDSFAVAARVLACQSLDIEDESDISYLKKLQEVDGGWEIGWVCRYGRTQRRIGSRGVVTAFAIKVLEQDKERR